MQLRLQPGLSDFIRSPSESLTPIPSWDQSPTHSDSHHGGAPRGILGNPGNVVGRGEPGGIVIGVQQLYHHIRSGTELLGCVHLSGQELGKEEEKAGQVLIFFSAWPRPTCLFSVLTLGHYSCRHRRRHLEGFHHSPTNLHSQLSSFSFFLIFFY